MKAWTVSEYGEPRDALKCVERVIPEPGPGELQMQVHAVGFGLPDVLMCRNQYLFAPERPFVPGQEVAGIVTAAGEGCSTPVGARVMAVTAFYNGHGGYAETAIALDSAAFTIPETMSAPEAATFAIPFHTAYVGLVLRAGIKVGDWVLVLGAAGGTGCAAIQLAHALGAKVIACASTESKLAACKEWGADALIDYTQQDMVAAVMDITEGAGADIIYDPVGGDLAAGSIQCIANEGRLLAVGFASGSWVNADTELTVLKNCSVMGVYVGAYAPDEMRGVHLDLLDLYEDGKIRPVLDRTVEFDDIASAMQDLADRKVQGKLVAKLV